MNWSLIIAFTAATLSAVDQWQLLIRWRHGNADAPLARRSLMLQAVTTTAFSLGYAAVILGATTLPQISGTVFRWALIAMFVVSPVIVRRVHIYVETRERERLNREALDRLQHQLIQNAGHELRTPLTPIIVFAEMLLNGDLGILQEQQVAAVSTIHQRGRALHIIVNMIIELLREPFFERVNLSDITLYAVGQIAERAAARHVELNYDYRSNGHRIFGDMALLQMAVYALLSNAVKFTEPEGKVWISVTADGRHVTVEVRDNGIGIAPEHLRAIDQHMIYQADGSTTRRYEGIGLGLAVVKRAATLHEGRVEIDSTPGEGTAVRLILPRQ